MANGISNLSMTQPSDYAIELSDIERRKKLAELLQAQGTQASGGTEMVGGWAIPKSPWEGIGKASQQMSGAYQQNQLTERQKEIAQAQRTQGNSDVQGFMQALQGTPAQPEQSRQGPLNDDEGNAMPGVAAQPAVAGDRQKALGIALQSQNPMVAGAGQSLLAEMLKPKEMKAYKPGDVLYQDNKQVGAIPAKPTEHVINGSIYSSAPTGVTKVGGPGIEETWGEPYKLGGQTVQRNSQTGQIRQAVTLPPQNTNITKIETNGPKAFETELGKLDAEKLGEWRKNAETAKNTLGVAQNMRTAIDSGVYSGGAAGAKTAAANMINGITGATPKNLPGSQLYNSEASKLVLDHVKTLGANPSNADRDFIEKTVPMLSTSPQARDAMISFIEKKSKQAIDLYQKADVHARKNHGLGGFDFIGANPGGDIHSEADAILRGK